jgi:hypothetical protein
MAKNSGPVWLHLWQQERGMKRKRGKEEKRKRGKEEK